MVPPPTLNMHSQPVILHGALRSGERMLLNEFLKEHKAFLEEKRKVQELEANAVRQQKQIDALNAGLQKVSTQLELNQRAPKTVLNNH